MNDHFISTARSARLYYIYARAVDERDLDTLGAIATDDITFTITGSVSKQGAGVEAFLDLFRAQDFPPGATCKHLITNVMAENVGAEIFTHAYFQAIVLSDQEARVTFGVYRDVHREVRGALLIAHKKIEVQRVLHLPASVAVQTSSA